MYGDGSDSSENSDRTSRGVENNEGVVCVFCCCQDSREEFGLFQQNMATSRRHESSFLRQNPLPLNILLMVNPEPPPNYQ